MRPLQLQRENSTEFSIFFHCLESDCSIIALKKMNVQLDLACQSNTPLLHVAAAENNVDLVKHLIAKGHNVNTRNSSGDTVLITALKSRNLTIVNVLLDANVNVNVSNPSSGKSALQIIVEQWKRHHTPEDLKITTSRFVDKLKNHSNLNDRALFKILDEAKCSVECIWPLNDPIFTCRFLKRGVAGGSITALKIAIDKHDLVNVELLLKYGNEYSKKLYRWKFYQYLSILFKSQRFETWKVFIEVLPRWNLIEEKLIEMFDKSFSTANAECLQVLLNSKIHEHVIKKLGIDLRLSVVKNRNINIHQLKSLNLDVNARNHLGETVLHLTVMRNCPDYLSFLLNSGAVVNSEDRLGRTVLFKSIVHSTLPSVQMLLEYGADVQVIDAKQNTSIFKFAEKNNPVVLEALIARLVLDQVQGIKTKHVIYVDICSKAELLIMYNSCLRQIKHLKSQEVFEKVTWFDILIEKVKMSFRSLYSRHDSFDLLDEYNNQNNLQSLYYSILKNKLITISNLYKFRCKIAHIISDSTGKLINFDHLVIEKISEYLIRKDIDAFLEIFDENADLHSN